MADLERPRRNLVKKIQVASNTLHTGYRDFTAPEVIKKKSGLNNTNASVTVGGHTYNGSSEDIGHAEMDAINQAIAAQGITDLDTLIGIAGKTVTCVGKPVCYRCSIMLGLLGFAPAGQTTKTASGMGQTQWVLPGSLNELVLKKYGDIVGFLAYASNIDEV